MHGAVAAHLRVCATDWLADFQLFSLFVGKMNEKLQGKVTTDVSAQDWLSRWFSLLFEKKNETQQEKMYICWLPLWLFARMNHVGKSKTQFRLKDYFFFVLVLHWNTRAWVYPCMLRCIILPNFSVNFVNFRAYSYSGIILHACRTRFRLKGFFIFYFLVLSLVK